MVERKESINGIKIPYEKEVSELQLMINSTTSDFLVACIALGCKTSTDALDVLIEYANSPDWTRRRAIAEAIGHQSSSTDDATDVIVKLLSDRSQYVIRTACDTVAKLRIMKAHDKIISLLNSEDNYTREIALNCLQYIWDDNDFLIVLNIFKITTAKSLSNVAGLVLFNKADASNWRLVYGALKISELPRHRASCCRLVERFGVEDDIYLLDLFKHDVDGHVRKACKLAMESITFCN